MSISYDPMTGEPIETNDDVKETKDEAVEAAKEATEAVEEVAKTTEEAAENAAEVTKEAVDEVVEVAKESTENVPPVASPEPVKETYSPIPDEPEKSGKKNTIIGIIAVALVAIIVVCVLFFSGIFMSKRDKVAKATAATFKYETELGKVVKNLSSIAKSGSYTTEFNADLEDFGEFSGSVIVDGKDKQIVGSVDSDMIPAMTIKAGIDSKKVKVEVPELCDYLFVYDYTADNDGYITEMLSEDDIKSLNSSLKMIYDGSSSNADLEAKIKKCLNKHFKELKFENADKESYKIDGKKVDCKGYSVEVDSDFYLDLYDDLIEIYKDEFEDTLKDMEDLTGESLDDSFKEARNELKHMPDMTVYFYIYKGKLAAIKGEGDKKSGEVEIQFKGGDFRAQNIAVLADGDEIMAISGTNKKDKETYTIEADGDEVCTLEYNAKKGTLTFEYDYYYDSFELEMDVKSSSNEVSFVVDDFDFDDEVEGSMSITFKKGAKTQKYTNSDEFDIGNAEESDFEDLMESFDQDLLMEFGGLLY
ncbi:MAG: hypothetical protein J6Z05_02375 [Lachnospiraceae bacterium]|nr:hypothetical protein [Lachnospiraceae bacterium]